MKNAGLRPFYRKIRKTSKRREKRTKNKNKKMEHEEKKKKRSTATSQQLAALFDVNVRTIQRLTKDGVLPAISSNPYIYDTLQAVQRYIRYLTNRVEGETRDEAYTRAEFEKLRAEANLRMTQDKRARHELRRVDNNMHEAADVARMYENVLRAVSEKLETLPEKYAASWEPGRSAAENSHIIKRGCFEILNELAAYDVEAYEDILEGREREQKKREREKRKKETEKRKQATARRKKNR